MNKPNVIILLMSCNKDIFRYQERVAKATWLYDIDKYPNFNYYFYRTGDYEHIDENDHVIYVTGCTDELDNTFLKTVETFKICNNFDYDYIIRSNCSTYINLFALDMFINYIYENNDTRVFSGDYSFYRNFFLIRGNSMVLNRSHINQIIDFDFNLFPDAGIHHDDVLMSYVFLHNYKIGYTREDFINNDVHKYYGFLPCIYFNDADRLKHPFARFDDDFLFLYNVKDKLEEFNTFNEYDFLNSVFIAFRKGLKYEINRYNELGECFKIDDYIRKNGDLTYKVTLDNLAFFIIRNKILLWDHNRYTFTTI